MRLALLLLVVNAGGLVAQQMAPLLHPDPNVLGSELRFGVDKIANTFLFTGNADITQETPFGTLRWVNAYRSSAFRTQTTAIRDDETSQLGLEFPLGSSITALLRQSWILSRDSRSLGLSSLERLNGAAGLRYEPIPEARVELLGGLENTTQLGQVATGSIVGLSGRLRDFGIDDWLFSSRLLADYHRMDAQRTNTDAEVRADVVRTIGDGSALRVAAAYTSLRRDFFTTLTGAPNELSVETRGERRVQVDANVMYQLTENVRAGMTASVQMAGIDRQYGQAVADIPITAVNRNLSELVIDLNAELEGRTASTTGLVSASLYRRDEQNGVLARFGIAGDDLASLQSQEKQRDNNTLRTSMMGRGEWRPSRNDTVRLEGTTSLLRYDTPSDVNYDDRDELTGIVKVSYTRRVSEGLAASVELSGKYLHTVFLKAQRSSQNNENRVIRLAPQIWITGRVVTMRPLLEVLANYTVYDFEDRAASIRSFSFRQISYRDSMLVRLTPTLHGEAQILIRYDERSLFAWADFAEAPETSNLEYLTKFLVFSRLGTILSVGAGVRLYSLERRMIDQTPGLPGLGNSVRFWAPETSIRYTLTNGSTLTVSGWYEFQRINVTGRRELPNLLLQAHVLL